MKYYTLQQTAKICGVHERTVRRWIKVGKIEAERLGKFGRHRIAETEIPSFLRKENHL